MLRTACILLFLTLSLAYLTTGLLAATNPPPVWGAPADLVGPILTSDDFIYGPSFDGQGNAYAVVMQSEVVNGQATAFLVKSNGASGTWGAPQTIDAFPSLAFCPAPVVDFAGDVTVLCQVGQDDGGFNILAFRYTANAGWLTPVTLYQVPYGIYLSAVLGTADSAGDVIAVIGFQNAGTRTAAISIVYQASTQKWSQPVNIAPLNLHSTASNLTLRANREGTAIFFAYLDNSENTTSLHAQRFETGTLTWSEAKLLPGTTGGIYSVATSTSQMPLAVDGSGAASLFFNLSSANDPNHADVQVSRYQNGAWGPATGLFQANNVNLNLESYASADANSTQTGAVASGYRADGEVILYYFLYDGRRWTSGTVQQYAGNGLIPLVFNFTGTANAAVVLYEGSMDNVLSTLNGNGWSTPSAIPQSLYGKTPAIMGTNSQGQTVAGYLAYTTAQHLYASWLQN
jgi:hypothetical protein